MAGAEILCKADFATVADKKRTVERIERALTELDGFLILGHKNADEDCVASMVAFGLLASKLNKSVFLYLHGKVHKQFGYLVSICTYNSIRVLGDDEIPPVPIQAIVLLDTPKDEMIEASPELHAIANKPGTLRIEVDHHLGADSTYFGDEGYRLVGASSSSAELVGYLALKIDADPDFRKRFGNGELLSRNFVLAVLTGIIADSRMGTFLKTRREKQFYERFSGLFDKLLAQKTVKGSGNFASKEEVYAALTALSTDEERCYRFLIGKRGKTGSVDHVVLDAADAQLIYKVYGEDTMTAVAKAVADALAEENGRLGLVAYPDPPDLSDFHQFRLRRSQSYQGLDLRSVLETFSIANGGGHPGAIGFRFERSTVSDFAAFAAGMIAKIDGLIPS
ncbi:MAG: DHH family phosphoesterase [Spirochaetaceae bacterium]|nr:DHH family phosphoesterase [Spirochaetaceae bacterium]